MIFPVNDQDPVAKPDLVHVMAGQQDRLAAHHLLIWRTSRAHRVDAHSRLVMKISPTAGACQVQLLLHPAE
jgi:hypothetical protein